MLGLLGDEWTLLIVRESLLGARRFTDFTTLPISAAVLTGRLRALVDDGLLERRVYQQQPLRAGYLPTERCQALWPVLVSIWHWERTWVDEHATTLPAMEHTGCGVEFSPVLRCAGCRRETGTADITGRWGPSGGWQRSVPRGTTRRRTRGDAPGLFPETMAIFGNRWASAIIGAAFLGTRRFSDFQTRLGAPAALVAEHLRVFCDIGVLQAAAHPRRADWSEYHLTPKGRAFYPVVAASIHWAEEWFGAPEGSALVLTHTACGTDFVPELACDQCDRTLSAEAVRVVNRG
ncbi:HxlR family transcriptional regulator [Mycobacterium sp. 852013-51886_SCH5428379]|uniref:winged helix-turn-helix transcriptional regulator n=1 Tax=Mycobacterium sp. 852013-51886_SCH5428379 TaxID=1834111 RepID=UPI0007FFE875|nr:helix-turn-helix domain-containing protein [Mycobacterium sp. 852013-51886_SCH5428379]OBB59999.1 HxlR family transcriptional regulator [Mycobacterium sp. 852013-51886_SCH5428379]